MTNISNIISIIFIFSILIFVPLSADAEVIFQENFDDSADWRQLSERDSCNNTSCPNPAPGNWTYYNNDETWHPSNYPTKQATGNVSSFNYRGVSGKAYTHWNESNTGTTGDGWGNDGMLIKYLGKEYSEIYIQLWVKFEPGFQWHYTVDGGSSLKFFRAYRWDGVGGITNYNTNGPCGPIYFWTPGHNYWDGWKHINVFRCYPTSNYYCENRSGSNYIADSFIGNPSFTKHLGDGNWHKLQWHLKMNSAPSVSDGVMEFWADDVLEARKTDIQWIDANPMVGWNMVAIGGNVHNQYSDESNKAEQWYAIDDIIVSTTALIARTQGVKIVKTWK